MHIVSFVASILALLICWMPFWAIPVTFVALVLSLITFYKFFISDKKSEKKKGKALVFTGFVLSLISVIGSLIMTGIPVAMFLLMYQG